MNYTVSQLEPEDFLKIQVSQLKTDIEQILLIWSAEPVLFQHFVSLKFISWEDVWVVYLVLSSIVIKIQSSIGRCNSPTKL